MSRGIVNLREGGSSVLRGVVLSRRIVNLRGGFQCPERSSIESRDCKLKGGSSVLRVVVLSRGFVISRGGGGGSSVLGGVVLS